MLAWSLVAPLRVREMALPVKPCVRQLGIALEGEGDFVGLVEAAKTHATAIQRLKPSSFGIRPEMDLKGESIDASIKTIGATMYEFLFDAIIGHDRFEPHDLDLISLAKIANEFVKIERDELKKVAKY